MENKEYVTKVTDVKVFPFKGAKLGHILAMVNITLNDCFFVKGLRLMDGENGLYVGYPNDPFYHGEDFKSIVAPLTKPLYDEIASAVIGKYKEILDTSNP